MQEEAQAIADRLGGLGALPASLTIREAGELFAGCFPIHPLSLLLLPTLCQKIAQNERTLFSYLGSSESHGFLDSLARLDVYGEHLPWILPWEIYEYFILTQPGLVTDYIAHRRWAEVMTAVDRLGDAAMDEVRLLKTIGLCNIVGAQGGLKSSAEILELATPAPGVAQAVLQTLTGKSVITYRKFSGEYRVWQGSDFDLEAARQAQLDQIRRVSPAELLNARRVLPPVVARRYSTQTGTLRYFALRFIDATSIDSLQPSKQPTIYYCLAENPEEAAVFERALARLPEKASLGAIVESGRRIREVVTQAIALERVQRTSPELANDPVAQRELKDALGAARREEHKVLSTLIEEPESLAWIWRGERRPVASKWELQLLLSEVLSQVYPSTPLLRSELINRDKPSASAVAGRKKLLTAMLDHADKPDLGIDKFPGEKAGSSVFAVVTPRCCGYRHGCYRVSA